MFTTMRTSMMSRLNDVTNLIESDFYASYFITLAHPPHEIGKQWCRGPTVRFVSTTFRVAVAKAMYNRD